MTSHISEHLFSISDRRSDYDPADWDDVFNPSDSPEAEQGPFFPYGAIHVQQRGLAEMEAPYLLVSVENVVRFCGEDDEIVSLFQRFIPTQNSPSPPGSNLKEEQRDNSPLFEASEPSSPSEGRRAHTPFEASETSSQSSSSSF